MGSVERVVFGCEQLGGVDWGEFDWRKVADAINYAWEQGVRWFDTAGSYGLGLSEERLAVVLGDRRHNATICSKGGIKWQHNGQVRATVYVDNSEASLRADLEASLKRLRLEQLPVFLVHRLTETTDIESCLDALGRFKEEGKIGDYGFSNYPLTPEDNLECLELGTLAQFSYSLLDLDQNAHKISQYHEAGLSTMVYGVLAQGLLTGKYSARSIYPQTDRRHRLPYFQKSYLHALEPVMEALKRVGTEYDISIAQVALAFVLREQRISSIVLGSKKIAQIREALDIAHNASVYTRIDFYEVDQAVRTLKRNENAQ